MRLAAVVSLALAGGAAAAPPAEVAALQKHIHQVIDGAKPSVACVLVSRSTHYADFRQGPSAAAQGRLGEFRPPIGRFMDPAQRDLVHRLDLAHPETVPEAYGSGVAVGDQGHILTNFHVIDGATKVYVRLPGPGRGSYADILAADPRADLAVLKMLHPPADLKPIPIGDGEKVREGDWVVSLANPFAAGFRDGNPSVSWGVISNLRRRVPGPLDESRRAKPLAEYGTLLQTDVRLDLGCSGGALVNMDGQLIGLTTALAAVTDRETTGGYAIPTDANTRKMIDVLLRGEEIEYGLLGVTVNPEERGNGRGVAIQEVSPGLPAARAGLQSRDVVVAINDVPVREPDDLFLNVSAALAGSTVDIAVDRAGRRQTFKVRLAKSTAVEFADKVIAANRPKPLFGLRIDYSSTLPSGANPPEGVVVRALEPDSPAARKLKEGMVVTAVDGQPVPTPADFYRVTDGKRSVTLDVVEAGPDGTRKKVTLP